MRDILLVTNSWKSISGLTFKVVVLILLALVSGLIFPPMAVIVLSVIASVIILAFLMTSLDMSYIILLWLCAFPFYRQWDLVGAESLPNISVDRIIWLLAIAVFLIQVLLRVRKMLPIGKIEIMMFLFTVVCIISMFRVGNLYSRDPFSDFLSRHLIPFSIFILAKNLFDSEKKIRNLFVVLSVIGLYLGLTGIFEHFQIEALVFPKYILDPEFGSYFGRARGPFLQAAANGAVLGMLSIYMLHLVIQKKAFTKIFPMISLASILIATFFTYTRAAYLGLLASSVFVISFYPKLRKKILPLVPLVGLIAFLGLPNMSNKFQEARGESSLAVYDRINLYATALNMFASRPLFGSGFYKFPEESPKYFQEVIKVPRKWVGQGHVSHNTFLEVLADLGLAGFIPLVLIFYYIAKQGLTMYRVLPNDAFLGRGLILTLWGVEICFIINSMFIVQNKVFLVSLFFLIAGVIAGIQERLGLEVHMIRHHTKEAKYHQQHFTQDHKLHGQD